MVDPHTEPTGRKRALVTGASTGLGRAFARRLAADGHDVVLVARRRDALEAVAKECTEEHGVASSVVPADLSSEEGIRAVEQVVREDPSLVVLVNNAGFGTEGPFAELDADTEGRMVRCNAEALLRLTHAALEGMLRRDRGAVVNVSSGMAFVPAPYYATYGATKAFVNHLTEALAEELRGSRVLVQALCPGFTRTEFQERAGMDVSQIPDFLWMEPEAVVDASLDALQSGAGPIVIPGALNKGAGWMQGPLARGLARRALGAFGRRRLGS